MTTPTKTGMNRTGIKSSPVESKAMQEGAERLTQVGPTPMDGAGIRTRMLYARDAEIIGTMPPPASLKGAARTAMQALKGHKATVFLDQLGDRAAFERTGTRLYDGLLIKLEAEGSWEGGPTAELLRKFREEELQHFLLIKECIEALGADPTAMTPTADASAVASGGLVKVINDPRMSLEHALHAIHIAELADNDAWQMLISLAESIGKNDFADRFRDAWEEENVHLRHVREWMTVRLESEATMDLEPAQP